MSKGRLQYTVDKYRAALRAHEAQAEQALEQAYAHVLKTLQPALDKLYDQMVNELAKGDKIPISWLVEAGRLEGIKKLISGQIDHFALLSQMQVRDAQQFAVTLGQESAQQMLQATVPPGVSWTFGIPDPKAIAELVGATQNGSPLADLFNGFGAEAADLAGQALIRSVTLGDNPRKVAADVQNALGVSRARALTISRDQLNNAYRRANLETYRANDDTVDNWVWSAAMDMRTCAVCIAMNGTVHPLSEDFEGHVGDRCAPIPQTKDWADILGDAGIDASGLNIPETSIQLESGADWFARQPESTQRAILGKAKLAAYKAGELQLSDLVHHGHDKDWGGYRQEKSLKDAIGAKKASKYYGK